MTFLFDFSEDPGFDERTTSNHDAVNLSYSIYHFIWIKFFIIYSRQINQSAKSLGWSSGQRARLLFEWSLFELFWSVQIFV